MRIQRTYYEVLGLPRTASPQEIKAKYHDLARQFHPDRAQDKVLAERLFVQINLAYRTLMDSDKRSIYDASLFASEPKPAAAPGASGIVNGGGARPAYAPVSQSPAAPPPPPTISIPEAINRANTAYMGGDRITAHKLCMQVLKVDERNPAAHVLVGDIYADQGRRKEALDEYIAAVQGGDGSRLLQEKIKRMQSLASAAPKPSASPPSAAPGQRPSSAPAPNGNDRPRGASQGGGGSGAQPKKEGLLGRIINRGR